MDPKFEQEAKENAGAFAAKFAALIADYAPQVAAIAAGSLAAGFILAMAILSR